MNKEELIKVLDAFEIVLKENVELRRDALTFMVEKGLWDEFMKYHWAERLKNTTNLKGD